MYCHVTQVISRVHPVHLMNAVQRQVLPAIPQAIQTQSQMETGPQTKPTVCRLLLSTSMHRLLLLSPKADICSFYRSTGGRRLSQPTHIGWEKLAWSFYAAATRPGVYETLYSPELVAPPHHATTILQTDRRLHEYGGSELQQKLGG